MHLEIINNTKTKILKATSEEIKKLEILLTAKKFIPRSGGNSFTAHWSAIEKMKNFPTPLLGRLKGLDIKVKGLDKVFRKTDKLALKKKLEQIGTPFTPHDHQLDVLNMMFGSSFGLYNISMNGGKSYINYLYAILRASQGLKTLIVVPRISLAEQMFNDFHEYASKLNGDFKLSVFPHGVEVDLIYNKSQRSPNANIIIGNSASLSNMVDETPSFFKSINYILLDECHTLIGNSTVKDSQYMKVVKATPYKGIYGYSGTIYDKKSEPIKALRSEAILGTCRYTVTAKELDEKGASATPIFTAHELTVSEELTQEYSKKSKNYIKLMSNGSIASFVNKEDILPYLKENGVLTKQLYKDKYYAIGLPKLLKSIKKYIPKKNKYKILNKTESTKYNFFNQFFYNKPFIVDKLIDRLSLNSNENQCVFFSNLADLFFVEKKLLNLGKDVVLFHGEIGVKEREEIKKRIETEDGLILLANYQVFSTGVSVKKLHRLHFFNPTKSYSRFLQSFGRIIRKHDDIPHVFIEDYYFKLHSESKSKDALGFSYKHFIERQKFIEQDLGYELKIIVN